MMPGTINIKYNQLSLQCSSCVCVFLSTDHLIFLSKLIWYVHEITAIISVDGLGCNMSTADNVFCIRQILQNSKYSTDPTKCTPAIMQFHKLSSTCFEP